MKQFRAKKGAQFSQEKAQVYGERIDQISQNKRVTPDLIVNDARDEESPLHDAFEWSNKEAAEKFRLHQARMLLNHLEIVVGVKDGKEQTYSSYLNILGDENSAREYIELNTVLHDKSLRNRYLKMAMDEAERWQTRYREYNELTLVFEAIEKTRVELRELITA